MRRPGPHPPLAAPRACTWLHLLVDEFPTAAEEPAPATLVVWGEVDNIFNHHHRGVGKGLAIPNLRSPVGLASASGHVPKLWLTPMTSMDRRTERGELVLVPAYDRRSGNHRENVWVNPVVKPMEVPRGFLPRKPDRDGRHILIRVRVGRHPAPSPLQT